MDTSSGTLAFAGASLAVPSLPRHYHGI